MSFSEVMQLLSGNWFVMFLLVVHAAMLLGFFVFIAAPNKKATRYALTATLFGICGGCIAVAAGLELMTGDAIQLLVR